MDAALQERKSQIFRLPVSLVSRLKTLAKEDKRSLNNYVECILYDAVGNIPNEETAQAIEDARNNRLEGTLNTESLDAMYKSMGL